MKLYNSHGELNEYFRICRCQLNFAMFCAISPLGISWQHLSRPNLHLRSVYRFHLHFYVRIILHHLGILLPQKDGFSRVKNSCIKNYSICDYYGVTKHGSMGIGFMRQNIVFLVMEKRPQKRSPLHSLTRSIITQSKLFARKSIEKISRPVRAEHT